MADVARVVRTSFWTSKMAMDMFSAEDTYFMLYLMTNPHTTQLGIYPINKKYMCIEFKHSIESINSLLDRFENKYKIIKYSSKTNEIAIKNYLENSIIKGGKPVEDCLIQEISKVQDKNLLEFVYQYLVSRKTLKDTVVKILPLLHRVNDNDKENDNDNERYVDVSYEEYNSEAADEEQANDYGCATDIKQTSKNKTKTMLEYDVFYQEIKKLYPNNLGKAISVTRKKEIYKLGDEFKRCIQRYLDDVKQRRESGFKTLNYQNLSTFLNSGYVPYLDAEWNKSHPQDTLEKTSPDSDYDENGVRIRSC